MKKLKKLSLNKEVVSSLMKSEQADLKGGQFSDGCSDGCLSKVLHTYLLNCSETNCTADCSCLNGY